MANYVIPPRGKDIVFVKCRKCKTLYAPEMDKNVMYFHGSLSHFENCPVCGCNSNDWDETISYARYRFLAFFRRIWK